VGKRGVFALVQRDPNLTHTILCRILTHPLCYCQSTSQKLKQHPCRSSHRAVCSIFWDWLTRLLVAPFLLSFAEPVGQASDRHPGASKRTITFPELVKEESLLTLISLPSAELVNLSAKLMTAIQVHDNIQKDEALMIKAEEKFLNLLDSPDLTTLDSRIDNLAQTGGLDPALLLTMSKAWVAAKDSSMVKDEVSVTFSTCRSVTRRATDGSRVISVSAELFLATLQCLLQKYDRKDRGFCLQLNSDTEWIIALLGTSTGIPLSHSAAKRTWFDLVLLSLVGGTLVCGHIASAT
jgi:hypothetical protein